MKTQTPPATSPLQRAVMRTRGQIIGVQAGAEAHLGYAYRGPRAALQAHLSAFTDRYGTELAARQAEINAQAQAVGETPDAAKVPLSWLHDLQGGNVPHLTAAVVMEMRAYGRAALGVTTTAKQEAASIGSDGAQQAMLAAVRPIASQLPNGGNIFKRPNDAAVRAFVDRAKDGKPLAALFDTFGPDEAQALRDTLAAGLAVGVNPRQLAREASDTIDRLSYGRAVTIMRTETLHAWNSAALENYRANRDVVESWQWMADKASACAACLAMDGSIHDLDTDLDDHPSGHCAKSPVTKGYAAILADFGIDASDEEFSEPPWKSYQSGADWLDDQDAATQRAAFGGNAAYNAWKSGDADLSDFAAVRKDRAWGDSIQQASLKSMGLDASDYSDD